MSSLTAIFGRSTDTAGLNQEKLRDLYWNRNELKKEFAALRSEKFTLADHLKAREGEIARLEQKLRHLEEMLTDPEWSRSIMVMYRLRGLNARCGRKLAGFAEQIKRQKERKKHGRALADWRAKNEAELAAIEADRQRIRESVFRIEEDLQQQISRLRSMNGFFRFFRRRSVNRRASSAAVEIAGLEAQEEQLRFDARAIATREAPDNIGLTLAEKRSLNFMIIAYAQELYAQFGDDDLVGHLREAADKSAGAVRYGADSDCEALLVRLTESQVRLGQAGEIAAVLRRRAKLISEGAVYPSDDDAVPLPGTVATLFRFDRNGVVRTSQADLLGGNVWGLRDALSR